jgi:hypothetical protein
MSLCSSIQSAAIRNRAARCHCPERVKTNPLFPEARSPAWSPQSEKHLKHHETFRGGMTLENNGSCEKKEPKHSPAVGRRTLPVFETFQKTARCSQVNNSLDVNGKKWRNTESNQKLKKEKA